MYVRFVMHAALPPEGESHEAEHVEGGHGGNDHADKPHPRVSELECFGENFIFRPEPGEWR